MAHLIGERWNERDLEWSEKPTPEEVAAEMRDCDRGCTETRHGYGDAILCATLRACGYGEAADIFAEWHKWYA